MKRRQARSASRSLTRRAGLAVSAAIVVALLNGCALWRPLTVPMRTIVDAAPCLSIKPDTLVVMLPGSYSLPEEFLSEGFVQRLRARHLAADIVLVDAHVGYYRHRTIVDRLAEDVIRPARAKGYRHIWLVGISIGAVGAILYADARPDDVEGVVLIAPYLGTYLSARDIELAGGLNAWRPPPAVAGEELDPMLWRWLQRQAATATSGKAFLLFLGYGLDDRFVFNDRILSQALPPERVFTAPGGHDWPPWTTTWARIVDALPIPADESCGSNGEKPSQ